MPTPSTTRPIITPDEARIIASHIGGDGWTIFHPPSVIAWGIRAEVVNAYTHTLQAGTGKYAIYTDNGPVPELRGVYGLTLLDAAARDIGADTKEADSKMGRGFRASCLASAITERLKVAAHVNR